MKTWSLFPYLTGSALSEGSRKWEGARDGAVTRPERGDQGVRRITLRSDVRLSSKFDSR